MNRSCCVGNEMVDDRIDLALSARILRNYCLLSETICCNKLVLLCRVVPAGSRQRQQRQHLL